MRRATRLPSVVVAHAQINPHTERTLAAIPTTIAVKVTEVRRTVLFIQLARHARGVRQRVSSIIVQFAGCRTRAQILPCCILSEFAK